MQENDEVRVGIHVRPGSSRTSVGGEFDGALVVRVAEPAEGGRATEAALRAVVVALRLPRRSVTLVRGTTSRNKIVDIDVDGDDTTCVALAIGRLRSG